MNKTSKIVLDLVNRANYNKTVNLSEEECSALFDMKNYFSIEKADDVFRYFSSRNVEFIIPEGVEVPDWITHDWIFTSKARGGKV